MSTPEPLAPARAPRRPETAERSARAPVMEVFASIQGEGLFVGEPQTFVRLRGCPLRCRYCDTPGSWELARDEARVDARHPDTGELVRERHAGLATAFQVLCFVAAAEGGRPRTISVTGGEPLLWPEFVLELARLRGERRVHLETGGGHPRALARVARAVQHVSLDLKLPGDLDAPVELPEVGAEPAPRDAAEWRQARRAALAVVRGLDACGKVVLTAETSPGELARCLDEVEELAPELPVVLAPATPVGGVRAPDRAALERAVELALERGLRARVLPQVHRALGLP